MYSRERECMASCHRCHDLFSLTIIDRRGEVTIELTPSLGLRDGTLIHRPGICDGTVHLISNDQSLKELTSASRTHQSEGDRLIEEHAALPQRRRPGRPPRPYVPKPAQLLPKIRSLLTTPPLAQPALP